MKNFYSNLLLLMSPKGKISIVLIAISITCGFGILGFFVGSKLFGVYTSGKFARWISLGVPPEKAIRISRLYPNHREETVEVEVETISGNFYRYDTDQNKWIKVAYYEAQQPEHIGSCDRIPSAAFDSFLNTLPSKPVDCETMIWSWEWIANDVHFIVLEDGSVWWWHYYTGFDRLAFFLCSGTLVGILLGLSIFIILRHRQHLA